MRASSASQVAAALPGGDPLAAALAAGETPSPEMVAAAGSRTACLQACRTKSRRRRPGDRAAPCRSWPPACVSSPSRSSAGESGEVLRDFSERQELLAGSWNARQAPAAWAGAHVVQDLRLGRRACRSAPVASNISERRPGLRVSREPAAARSHLSDPGSLSPTGRHGARSAAPADRDEEVRLDPEGRLKELHVVPEQVEKLSAPAAAASAPDWTPLFRAAGLDASRTRPRLGAR